MGLIKAAAGAVGGVLADQWKEFFSCDALSNDVLVAKGNKTVSGRSSNTKGSDNVISNGSGIVVADGQCMMIVEQGKVVEVCAEPGQFTYDNSIAPSIFSGNLGESIIETFKEIGKRFTYGGQVAADQRRRCRSCGSSPAIASSPVGRSTSRGRASGSCSTARSTRGSSSSSG